MAEDTGMVEELLAQCQEAYEEAGGRNPPPNVDQEWHVVVKKVALKTFINKDQVKTAVLVPILEITNESEEGWIMDGDNCGMASNYDNFRDEANLSSLKRLATILNNGVPFPNVRDAWEAVKGCAGTSLIVKVEHKKTKGGVGYSLVSPTEKL